MAYLKENLNPGRMYFFSIFSWMQYYEEGRFFGVIVARPQRSANSSWIVYTLLRLAIYLTSPLLKSILKREHTFYFYENLLPEDPQF